MDFENENQRLLTEAVWFDEAVNWVAFRQWGDKAIGPQWIRNFESGGDEESIKSWGRHEFAEELLWEAVGRGEVRALGKKIPLIDGEYFSKREEEEKYSIIPKKLILEQEFDWEDMGDNFSRTDIDFGNGIAYGDVLAIADDVTTLWPAYNDEPRKKDIEQTNISPEKNKFRPHHSGRGRPPKYLWEKFFHKIILIANTPDGLPETQAGLERKMANWCSKEWGHEPTESTIRSKISPIYQSIKNQGR